MISLLFAERICAGEDWHAQAQHWLRRAQAQVMHAQAQPYLIGPRSYLPATVSSTPPASSSLIMHKLSVRMPEPMLSLSMLILATDPVADIRPRSKPKSKLTSPNFNIVAFGDLGRFLVDSGEIFADLEQMF